MASCRKPLPAAATLALALALAAAAQNPFFTPGNLAVLRAGDGAQALDRAPEIRSILTNSRPAGRW